MANEPPLVVEICGIKEPSRGRKCEWHEVCGSVLEVDSMVTLRTVMVNVDGNEEKAISAVWLTDGVERCRVGFLPRHLVKHKDRYEGKLCQVTSFLEMSDNSSDRRRSHRYRGIATAIVVGSPPSNEKKKRKRLSDNDEEKEDDSGKESRKSVKNI